MKIGRLYDERYQRDEWIIEQKSTPVYVASEAEIFGSFSEWISKAAEISLRACRLGSR